MPADLYMPLAQNSQTTSDVSVADTETYFPSGHVDMFMQEASLPMMSHEVESTGGIFSYMAR